MLTGILPLGEVPFYVFVSVCECECKFGLELELVWASTVTISECVDVNFSLQFLSVLLEGGGWWSWLLMSSCFIHKPALYYFHPYWIAFGNGECEMRLCFCWTTRTKIKSLSFFLSCLLQIRRPISWGKFSSVSVCRVDEQGSSNHK